MQSYIPNTVKGRCQGIVMHSYILARLCHHLVMYREAVSISTVMSKYAVGLKSKYRLLLGFIIDICAGFSGRCCRLVFTQGDLLE